MRPTPYLLLTSIGLAVVGLASTGLADTGLADTGLAGTRVADIRVADTRVADLGTPPARAAGTQYPVCLHVYGPVTYDDCSYVSLAQCAPSAVGRSAQCMANPFHVPAERRVRRR